ncbi:hypothetical protein BKA70DRAFT_43612 [Coprinopsis sp. MPI-PUGE-AT-0042]|nr:hypothetical protein BKA70DRAFT_43612 [Coprinopsis sp. MPI-PUGE-AT-0042]
MLDWFSLTNFRAMLIDNLEKRASGTGRKFIDGRLLEHWIKVKGSMLWGTGMPGAGKTVLASTVYDYLQTIAETAPPGAISVSFAYCRYTEAMSVRDILASLVRQFLERHPSLIPFAEPLYQRHSLERTKPTQADLVRLLVTMAKQFEMSYFGLDGLDEAKDDVQFNVLKIFSSLDVNFFITSRPLKMLESVLPQARHFNIAAHEDDIDLMFRERIDQNPACGHLFSRETFREEIIQAIKHKSSGMFLHAALQVEALQRCLSVADVRETVDGFPAKLEDMYQQTMDRISNQPKNHFDLAMRILTLLIHARGPLTIEDIQYALTICPETRSYHPERSVSQVHLVAVCCGLITLDKGSRSVRLIHYTARSMLEPAVLRHRPQPHADLTSACIGRLLASVYLTRVGPPKNEIRRPSFAFSEMEGFLLQGTDRRMAGRQPFLTYALGHWVHHARMCYSGLKDSIDDFIHRCHSLPSPFANARKVMPLGGPHLAAWHGFFHSFSRDQWVAHLHDRTIHYRWTPLMCALRNRQIDTSNMLSQLPDTDVNVQDWKGKTTLMHAVAVGHCGVISRLIANTNSDINRRDNEGRTALILAIEGEKVAPGPAMEAPNPTILKLVLSHPKIDVNSEILVGTTLPLTSKHEGGSNLSQRMDCT